MGNLSIKVVVAGRAYPLNVKEEEKESIEKAAESINKTVNFLKENYAVKDAQDLLAMTALQLATKAPQETVSVDVNTENIEKELEGILQTLEAQINS